MTVSWSRRWLRDAELALARDEFGTAAPLLRQADTLWPGEARVAAGLATIAQRQQHINKTYQDLLALVRERRFQEAHRNLGAFARQAPITPTSTV